MVEDYFGLAKVAAVVGLLGLVVVGVAAVGQLELVVVAAVGQLE